MLNDGEILKGRYKIANMIGKGGMSRVYMATDQKLVNKLWAVKEVSRRATDQAGRPIEQSLAMEAELLSKLDHPMIVDIVDIITTEQYIYVVMDFVEGRSLDKVVREEGPQSEEDVQNWMIQICDALDYLHNQDPPIIYRDMKPSNIMLRPDGYVKLIDLGVAREYKDESKKDTIAFGTEGYAPPEQYGRAQTDARADIYALGATMWHLLTGEAPSEYPLPDCRTKLETISEGFANVIIPKCCELDRDLRYQNCDQLVADLEVYEELTQEYYNNQLNKIKKCGGTAIAGIVMCLCSILLFFIGSVMITQNYQAQLEIAGNATATSDVDTAENAYKEAIAYKPGESKPYLELLKLYETKTEKGTDKIPVLTISGLGKVNDLLLKHNGELKGSGNYAQLNYEIGREVWDNYDDGANTTQVLLRDNAIFNSLNYFRNARDNTNDVNISNYSNTYIKIGEFKEQILDYKEDNDGIGKENKKTLIEDYFTSLENLLNDLIDNGSDKVKLNAYAVIQKALYDYADDFQSSGISKKRVETLANETIKGLNKLSFETEIYKQALSECKVSAQSAASEVEKAYSNSKVGNK